MGVLPPWKGRVWGPHCQASHNLGRPQGPGPHIPTALWRPHSAGAGPYDPERGYRLNVSGRFCGE
eukprot:10878681-Alexandrium_andersonii.AAC.1